MSLTSIRAFTLLALLPLPLAGVAEVPRELTWDDLLPPSLIELEKEASSLQKIINDLDSGDRDRYNLVARELIVRDKLAASVPESELSAEERDLLSSKPSAENPDALEFWNKVKDTRAMLDKQGDVVDSGIDGKRVRIPGYVLPLEFDGTEVREFLLVPYVGACIHVPPPPPNQMVFVSAEQSFDGAGLYAPVWVEGTISTSGGSHDLKLSDGQAPVDVGYSLKAVKVEPYK